MANTKCIILSEYGAAPTKQTNTQAKNDNGLSYISNIDGIIDNPNNIISALKPNLPNGV